MAVCHSDKRCNFPVNKKGIKVMNNKLILFANKAIEGKELTVNQAKEVATLPSHLQSFLISCGAWGAVTRMAEAAGYLNAESIEVARKACSADLKDLKESLGNPTKETALYKAYDKHGRALRDAIDRKFKGRAVKVAETTAPVETEPVETAPVETAPVEQVAGNSEIAFAQFESNLRAICEAALKGMPETNPKELVASAKLVLNEWEKSKAPKKAK